MFDSGVTERGVGTGWVISLREIKSTLLQSRGLFAAMWARRAYRRHLLARRSWEPAGAGQGSLGRTGPDQGTKGKKTKKQIKANKSKKKGNAHLSLKRPVFILQEEKKQTKTNKRKKKESH